MKDGTAVNRGQPLAFVGVEVRDEHKRSAAKDSLSALISQTDSVEAQMISARDSLAFENQRIRTALANNAREKTALLRQLQIQEAIVRSKEVELNRVAPVAEKGFISQMEMARRDQALLSERQRVEQMKQQLAQLDSRNDELSSQLRQLPIGHIGQQAALKGRLGALKQQESVARIEVGYTVLSPIDGLVTALQATPGRAVDARMPLLTIMPRAAKFKAILYAPSRAMGFTKVGQQVRISYDAFPFKRFGTFSGTISAISQTAYSPDEIDAPLKLSEPVYRIEVRLANEVIPAFGRPLPLQSGMTVQGTVILERRSFVDWLLQPLNSVRKRA